jgi:thiol:disulfide interchange protein DsbD
MLGFYFLGRLRLSHDSEVQQVGTVRLLFAMASFTFALYLLRGLFGAPLPAMSGIIPEPKGASVFAASTSSSNVATAAYGQGLCGEAKYANLKYQLSYGLPAYHDIAQAIECAKQQNKPVLLAFKFIGCSECKRMEAAVWGNEKVLDILRNEVVIAALYIDDKTALPESEWVTSTFDKKVHKTLGSKLRDYQVTRFGAMAQPFYVLIDLDEKPLTKPVASSSVSEFLHFLNSGIEAFNE